MYMLIRCQLILIIHPGRSLLLVIAIMARATLEYFHHPCSQARFECQKLGHLAKLILYRLWSMRYWDSKCFQMVFLSQSDDSAIVIPLFVGIGTAEIAKVEGADGDTQYELRGVPESGRARLRALFTVCLDAPQRQWLNSI